MKILVSICFMILCMQSIVCAQDYRKIFGRNYANAEKLLKEHEDAFQFAAMSSGIPSIHLRAIVFPELIRYSSVFDFMEITSLKVLYISNGQDYADFSVGYLQMKPSFAEKLERDALKYLSRDQLKSIGISLPLEGTAKEQREERVDRLTEIKTQLQYLALFYKLCERKFTLSSMSEEEKIAFISTCYNAGYDHSARKIHSLQTQAHFHTGRFRASDKFNYSSISTYWLRQQFQLASR